MVAFPNSIRSQFDKSTFEKSNQSGLYPANFSANFSFDNEPLVKLILYFPEIDGARYWPP